MNIFNLIWFDIVCVFSIVLRTFTQIEIFIYVLPTTLSVSLVIYPLIRGILGLFEKNHFSFMPKAAVNFFVKSAVNYGVAVVISYYILLIFALTQEIYKYGYNLTNYNFILNYLIHFGLMLPVLILVVIIIKKIANLWSKGWLR